MKKEQINTKPKTQFELSKAIIDNLYKFELNHTTSLVLVKLANHYPNIFPSQETIANTLGMSRASVNSAIKNLRDKNLIIYTTKRFNSYWFTNKLFEQLQGTNVKNFDRQNCDIDNLTQETSKNLTQDVKDIDTTCQKFRHKQISNKENNKKVNTTFFKKNSFRGNDEENYRPKGGNFTPIGAVCGISIPDEYKTKKADAHKNNETTSQNEEYAPRKMTEEQQQMGLENIRKIKEMFQAKLNAKNEEKPL